jgi:hypothetical protein
MIYGHMRSSALPIVYALLAVYIASSLFEMMKCNTNYWNSEYVVM